MADSELIIAGRYRILKKLGQGAFSTVYLARHLYLQTNVVLKIFESESEPSSVAAFEREASALASIMHPNIVRIFDTGVADGQPFLVLEWIDGRTLQDVLREGALPLTVALDVARAIAEALAAVHQKGLIHRDIKPSNILIPRATGGLSFE